MLASSELNSRSAVIAKPSPMPARKPAPTTAAVPAWVYRLLGVRPAPSLLQTPETTPSPGLNVNGIPAGSAFRCYPR